MGQKVNPHGLRVGVIKDWDSRWYARPDKVGDLIVEDDKIRKYLEKRLYAAGVPTIEIERDSAQVRIFIHCSRPGVIIGKGGTEIEKLRQDVEQLIGKKVAVSIVEERKNGPFLSQEAAVIRCPKVSKGVVELLGQIGALADMPESTQVSLF